MIINHRKIAFGSHPLIEKVTLKAPYRFAVNFPEEACFIYFAAGDTSVHSAYVSEEVKDREAVLLKCGSYFADLMPQPHSDIFEILVFHMPGEVIKEVYKDQFPQLSNQEKKPRISKIDASRMLEQFIEGLQFYFDNPQVVSNELLMLKIRELILLLLQTRNAKSIQDLFNHLFSPTEIDLKEAVRNHLFSDLSIRELAMLCNMSTSTFNRRFRRLFNESPSAYFRDQRLEKARELIETSTMTIKEIAYHTCFYDLAHFSRSFKEKFQCSPTGFRKKE